jgi:hypothetical protein
MNIALRSCVLVASLCAVACSDPPRFTPTDGGGVDGGGGGGNDAGARADRDPSMIGPDGGCATQNSPTMRAPVNMLLMVDRSGSMTGCADGSQRDGCESKWSVTQQGLERMLMGLEDQARVGLLFFPASSNASNADGYRMPVIGLNQTLRNSRMSLIAAIRAARPNGNTPMACAMPQAVTYMQNITDMGSRNIMLITDGSPTDECSGMPCANPFDFACLMNASLASQSTILASVARGARSMPQIRTFALGTPDAAPSFMSSVALNGGTARMAGCEPTSCHYTLGTADFERDLNMALDSVRDRAATCEFILQVDPMTADPNLINVYYTPMSGGAGRYIPRDTTHMNGWDYAPGGRSIIFYGMLCDEVRAGNAGSSVQIVYGCPTIIPG